MSHFIYTLSEPIDSLSKYIWKTNCIVIRFKEHLSSNKKTLCNNWRGESNKGNLRYLRNSTNIIIEKWLILNSKNNYESFSDVAKIIGSNCISKRAKSAGGFIWSNIKNK